MSAMTAPTWTPPGTGQRAQVPAGIDEAAERTSLLLANLTESGRGQFLGELVEAAALNGSAAGAVHDVWERWWRTLRLRNAPGFLEAMEREYRTPDDGVRQYQTTADLRAEVARLTATG
jgi:hypothetical protein